MHRQQLSKLACLREDFCVAPFRMSCFCFVEVLTPLFTEVEACFCAVEGGWFASCGSDFTCFLTVAVPDLPEHSQQAMF